MGRLQYETEQNCVAILLDAKTRRNVNCSGARRMHNKMSFLLSQPDARDGAAVEFEKIIFNAVAEDDAVLRHLRNDFQRVAGFDTTELKIRD
jgi:hypothetical protein